MGKRKKYAPIPAVLNEFGVRRRSPDLVPLVQMRKRIRHVGDASPRTTVRGLGRRCKHSPRQAAQRVSWEAPSSTPWRAVLKATNHLNAQKLGSTLMH